MDLMKFLPNCVKNTFNHHIVMKTKMADTAYCLYMLLENVMEQRVRHGMVFSHFQEITGAFTHQRWMK